MTDRTDENTLEAARRVLAQKPAAPPPPPPGHEVPFDGAEDVTGPTRRPPARRGRKVVFVVGLALLLVAAAVIGVLALSGGDDDSASSTTLPASSASSAPPTTIPVAGIVVDGLLGPIRGTTAVDDEAVAYTGELVTAPEPRDGEAVGWQWQLCPEADSAADECTAIGDATSETWTSPPTPDPVFIRVVVTVDLDGVRVRAASETYTAMSERPAPTTTAPPTTRPATTTEAPTTTTVPRNAYGDAIGATVTEAGSAESTFALAAAARSSTTSAAGSNEVQLMLRWIELRTAGAEPGTVTATADGYRVAIGSSVFELKDFTLSGETIADLTVCLDGASCAAASTSVYVPPTCEVGADGCGTLLSESRATSAIHRGTVTGVAPGPELMFETVSERPVTNVALDGTVAFSSGWFVVMLPAQPPAGAVQELTVTYGDGSDPDTITIGY